MIITEYNDCFSIKYTNAPDSLIDRETQSIAVELSLLNGRKTVAELAVKKKKDGTLKVVEVLLPKDLYPEEIEDIADLRWYVFPKKERGRKVLPFVSFWEHSGTALVACISPRYGVNRKSFAEQQRFVEGVEVFPDEERLLCWWPDCRMWEVMKRTKECFRLLPVKELVLPFYTFSEWLKRPGAGSDDKGLEYAAYLRGLRTVLLYCRQKGIEVRLTLGNAEKAHEIFSEKELDPSNPWSWSLVGQDLDEMPDVYVEKRFPGPVCVVGSGQKVAAALSFFSHMPDSPSVDCAAVSLQSGKAHLGDVILWMNPLAGDRALHTANDVLADIMWQYGADELYVVEDTLPFQDESGEMLVPAPSDIRADIPARRSQKVGRNDPCPCGSGKKYKNCCGKKI